MKVLKPLFTLTAIMLLFSATTFAQTATATATATILTPLSITKSTDLSFGNLSVTGAGTVLMATNGTRTSTGGVVFLPANPGTITAATFLVTGATDQTYTITLPSGNITLTDGGSNTMTVGSWISDPLTAAGDLGTGGSETVNVGATLVVGANQTAGVYTAVDAISVTVNYN